MAEFERFSSYAELWGVADEQTYIYMALSQLRLGKENKPNKFYMDKLTNTERNPGIKNTNKRYSGEITGFITDVNDPLEKAIQ